MDKTAIRKLIRQRKQACTADELRRRSAAIVEALMQHPRLMAAQTVLLYYSMPDEVDTHDLADRLVRQGKTVLLPKVVDDKEMEIRRYTGRHDLQACGRYQIMEPTGPLFTDYAHIDIVITPGVAFDHEGHRLGRGRGYYDRFFERCTDAYRLGLCFRFQWVEAVPVTPTDVAMDEVISEPYISEP